MKVIQLVFLLVLTLTLVSPKPSMAADREAAKVTSEIGQLQERITKLEGNQEELKDMMDEILAELGKLKILIRRF